MKKQRSLFFDTSLIYFIVILCFVGIRILSSLVKVSTIVGGILNIVIQVVVMTLIPFFMYKFMRKKKAKEVLKDFNVKPIGIKAILFAVLIGFIIYFLNLAVASFFNIFIFATGYDPSFGMSSASGGTYTLIQFLGDVLVTAILPGICEEFCHRGLLVNGYKQLDMKKTILLVGFLFGLMHLNIEQFFYATVIGAFLTFLVYVTGSIIPSMIIHFMNNFMGLYLVFAKANKLPLGNFSDKLLSLLSGNVLVVFLGIIFVIVIMLAILAFLIFKLMKSTRVKDFEKLARKAIEQKEREELFNEFNLDVNKVDAEAGVVKDENMSQVTINEAPRVNGKKSFVIDINFSKNLLHGDYFIKKPSLMDKAFLYGTIFLGVFITISTLIWGIL